MIVRSLQDAVVEIDQACDGVGFPPFVFIGGAGVSSPNIPLAGGIIKECRERAEQRGHKPPPDVAGALDEYSFWFDKAFPHPEKRRQYLERLIRGKPISPANF